MIPVKVRIELETEKQMITSIYHQRQPANAANSVAMLMVERRTCGFLATPIM